MATTTITKATVLKLARAKYRESVELNHYPKALSAEAKQELRERAKQLRERKQALEEQRKSMWLAGNPDQALLKAARFALDVDGDEPSWTQLRQEVVRSEHLAAIADEINEIESELKTIQTSLLSWRWSVSYVETVSGMQFRCIREQADSLEELASKLQPK